MCKVQPNSLLYFGKLHLARVIKKRMISSSVCTSIIVGLILSNFIIFAQLETNKDFMRKFNVQLSPYDITLYSCRYLILSWNNAWDLVIVLETRKVGSGWSWSVISEWCLTNVSWGAVCLAGPVLMILTGGAGMRDSTLERGWQSEHQHLQAPVTWPATTETTDLLIYGFRLEK